MSGEIFEGFEKTSLPTRRNPRGQTREGHHHEIMWNYFFVAALNAKASACLPEISNRANITELLPFFPPLPPFHWLIIG